MRITDEMMEEYKERWKTRERNKTLNKVFQILENENNKSMKEKISDIEEEFDWPKGKRMLGGLSGK